MSIAAIESDSMDLTVRDHAVTRVGGEQAPGFFSVDRVWYLIAVFDGAGQSLVLLTIAIAIGLLRQLVRHSAERSRDSKMTRHVR